VDRGQNSVWGVASFYFAHNSPTLDPLVHKYKHHTGAVKCHCSIHTRDRPPLLAGIPKCRAERRKEEKKQANNEIAEQKPQVLTDFDDPCTKQRKEKKRKEVITCHGRSQSRGMATAPTQDPMAASSAG